MISKANRLCTSLIAEPVEELAAFLSPPKAGVAAAVAVAIFIEPMVSSF